MGGGGHVHAPSPAPAWPTAPALSPRGDLLFLGVGMGPPYSSALVLTTHTGAGTLGSAGVRTPTCLVLGGCGGARFSSRHQRTEEGSRGPGGVRLGFHDPQCRAGPGRVGPPALRPRRPGWGRPLPSTRPSCSRPPRAWVSWPGPGANPPGGLAEGAEFLPQKRVIQAPAAVRGNKHASSRSWGGRWRGRAGPRSEGAGSSGRNVSKLQGEQRPA